LDRLDAKNNDIFPPSIHRGWQCFTYSSKIPPATLFKRSFPYRHHTHNTQQSTHWFCSGTAPHGQCGFEPTSCPIQQQRGLRCVECVCVCVCVCVCERERERERERFLLIVVVKSSSSMCRIGIDRSSGQAGGVAPHAPAARVCGTSATVLLGRTQLLPRQRSDFWLAEAACCGLCLFVALFSLLSSLSLSLKIYIYLLSFLSFFLFFFSCLWSNVLVVKHSASDRKKTHASNGLQW